MPIIFPDEIDLKIVFVGLANSGKTTLVRRLKDPNFDPNVSPTMGVAIELLEFSDKNGKSVQYLALDCGGQPAFARAIWLPHVQVCNGVVFLFDSTDPESINDTSLWLHEVLDWIKQGKNKDTPLLFLANKSDDSSALPLDEVIKKLNLTKFIGKSFGVYQISALKGTNVGEAFTWFMGRVSIEESN
ncbi:MAG: ADP-ribosylation factor-like protein [Candidatus Thorarchaeota archaeon]